MAKFKKGDRVRSLKSHNPYFFKGDFGTVDESGSAVPYVKWDIKTEGSRRWPAIEDYLELINMKTLPKEFYVQTYGDEDLSRAVQKQLFKHGFKWFCHGKTINYPEEAILHAHLGGTIGYSGVNFAKSSRCKQQEITLNQLFEAEIEPKTINISHEEACELIRKERGFSGKVVITEE
jgi:hypothetical protein